MTFLRVFGLTVGTFCLFGGAVCLWMIGLEKPADWLQDRNHLNWMTAYVAGYFILTVATVAGIIAAVA
jgi:hypothetical protein